MIAISAGLSGTFVWVEKQYAPMLTGLGESLFGPRERDERALRHIRGIKDCIEVGSARAAFRALPRPQLPPFPGFVALLGFGAR